MLMEVYDLSALGAEMLYLSIGWATQGALFWYHVQDTVVTGCVSTSMHKTCYSGILQVHGKENQWPGTVRRSSEAHMKAQQPTGHLGIIRWATSFLEENSQKHPAPLVWFSAKKTIFCVVVLELDGESTVRQDTGWDPLWMLRKQTCGWCRTELPSPQNMQVWRAWELLPGFSPGPEPWEQQVMGFINVIYGPVSARVCGLINYLEISLKQGVWYKQERK